MRYNRIFFKINLFSFIPFLFFCLSCGRTANIPEHLDHDFLFGASEGLYRLEDLKMLLSEEAAVIKTEEGHTLKNYEKLLSEKEELYDNNEERNIFSLEELLKVTTVAEGEKVKISFSFDDISIDPDIPFLNEYETLDYTVEEPKTTEQNILKRLLGKVEKFNGFPNTEYYILPKFLGGYLILYKLAPPDKIPYDELPLARRIGNMLAVASARLSCEAL